MRNILVFAVFLSFFHVSSAGAFELEGSCYTLEIEEAGISLICPGKSTSGDNLAKIAQEYQMSVKALKKLNNKKSNLVNLGEKINVRLKTVVYPATYSREEIWQIMDHFVWIYSLIGALLISIPIIYLFVYNLNRKKDLDDIKDLLHNITHNITVDSKKDVSDMKEDLSFISQCIEEWLPQIGSALADMDNKVSGQSKDLSKLNVIILYILRYDNRRHKERQSSKKNEVILLPYFPAQ